MDKEQMKQRIAALEKEREAFVAEANQRLAYMNGQIALLSELTAEPEAGDDAADLAAQDDAA